MRRSNQYKNKPCGYCGTVTGRNEGEHVLPKCIYPASTDPTVRRIKIPACPDCNDLWQDDEAYFRTTMAMAGDKPNWARRELWQVAERSFVRPDGRRDLMDAFKSMLPTNDIESRYSVFPRTDPRVLPVLRKIVRGLCHWCDQEVIIPDEHVVFSNVPLPPAFERQLATVYQVPDVFVARVQLFEDRELQLHSGWSLKFFDSVEFVAGVAAVDVSVMT